MRAFTGGMSAEGFLIGNILNFHEGLQLLSSTTVALFVCFGVARPANRSELVAGLLLFAMILAILPVYRLPAFGTGLSQEFVSVALSVCALSALALLLRGSNRYLRFGAAWGRLLPATPRPTDTTFHLFALVVILFLILVPEGSYAVYLMFDRSDFTHSRLSVLALLPLCSLFAVYLAELKTLPLARVLAQGGAGRVTATAFGMVLAAALLSWLIHGPLLDQLLPKAALQLQFYRPRVIVLPVAVEVALTATVLAAVLAGFLWWPIRNFDGRIAAAIVVATFAFVETVTYAHFKVDGPHTWTYPAPFGSISYMNVPPSAMRPPGDDALEALADKLQVEDFRSVLLSPPSLFRGAMTSHISQFWRARMIGGYGTGVPKRLAELPWPEGVRSLRMIELRSMSDINPELLSLLNVKFIVVPTADLYFNATAGSADKTGAMPAAGDAAYPGEVVNVGGISFGLIRNPVAPLPRQFLAERVTGVEETPILRGAVLEARARERPRRCRRIDARPRKDRSTDVALPRREHCGVAGIRRIRSARRAIPGRHDRYSRGAIRPRAVCGDQRAISSGLARADRNRGHSNCSGQCGHAGYSNSGEPRSRRAAVRTVLIDTGSAHADVAGCRRLPGGDRGVPVGTRRLLHRTP